MNEAGFFILFNAVSFLFIGYMIGDTRGFVRGIGSACDIWEKSYRHMSESMFTVVKKEGNREDEQ